MNLGFFTVMLILGVGVEASQGDKPIAVLHVRDGNQGGVRLPNASHLHGQA